MALTTVHAGWLTKSPPEKKLQGPLKFFKAHWRRRYFVLSTGQQQSQTAPSSPDLPLAYLHYYDNEKNPKKSRKKGCIDLTNCEEILAQLDSVFYEHVFSLRTKDRGKTRTYFLAADSIEDMNVWISCLCRVLKMNDCDSGMSSPEQFSPSLFGSNNFSAPNRKTSMSPRNLDLSPPPMKHPQSPPLSLPASPFLPPPNHSSMVFDYPSSYCQPEELSYGPCRGSQSYYPPEGTGSGSCYFTEAVSLSPSSDSPPPILPAKSKLRRSLDCLDPLYRLSEYSNNSNNDYNYNAAVSEFNRSRASCRSYAGDEYDVLPERRRFGNDDDDDDDDDKGYDYDVPPAARRGMSVKSNASSSGKALPPADYSANRASTSSYPDVFDEEVSGHRLPVLQSSVPPSIQVTSRTRSFRRSDNRSDPPVSTLETCEDMEEFESNSAVELKDKRILKKSEEEEADDNGLVYL